MTGVPLVLQGLCLVMAETVKVDGEGSKLSPSGVHGGASHTQEGCCGFSLVCGGTVR